MSARMLGIVGTVGSVGVVLAATDARAQVQAKVVAESGQQVPGVEPGIVFGRTIGPSGNTFLAFSDSVLDAAGRATFMSGFPTGQGTRTAYFRDIGSEIAPIWFGVQDDPARPGASAQWYDVHLGNDGATGGLIVEGPSGSMRFGYGRGEPFSVPALNAEPAAPGPTDTWFFQIVSSNPGTTYAFNRAGQGVFTHMVSTGTSTRAVLGFVESNGSARVLLRNGDPAPGTAGPGGPTILSPMVPVIGPDGTIVVASTMSFSPGPWLFAGTGAGLHPLLTSFDSVPGMPAGAHLSPTAFNTFPNVWPSAAVAPDGGIATILEFYGTGIPVQGAVLVGTAQGLQAIAHDMDAVNGLAPGTVLRMNSQLRLQILMARNQTIAFQCSVATPPSTSLSSTAVIVGTPGGGLHAAIQTGDALGTAPGVQISQPALVGVNAARDVLVDTSLTGAGANSSNNRALVAVTPDMGSLTLLRKGDPFTLRAGDVRIVSGFIVGAGISWLRNAQINDSREIAAVVSFTDGSDAVVIMTLPSPACRADFNRSGGVETQDIFEFLGAWFAQEPRADFNGVNGIETQDIFDFLAAWFAGC